MPRARSGAATRQRRKRMLKLAKGFRHPQSKVFRKAKEVVQRSLQFAYRDRRRRKRDFRRLWIIRINAAAHLHGLSYSTFIHGLQNAQVEINRKMLAEIAVNDPAGFAELAALAQEGQAGQGSGPEPAAA